jgi:hypothetical protein
MPSRKVMAIGVGALFVFFFFLGPASYPEAHPNGLQVVLRQTGQILWERSIAPGEPFYLVHRNSIYEATVWEAFQVDAQGAIWLNGVKTKSPAVLEYYGLEECSSGWISLSREIGRISLLVTALGKTRLEYSSESLALSELFPEGTLIEIRTRHFPQREIGRKG